MTQHFHANAVDLDALEALLAAVPRDPWRHDGVGRIEFLDGAGNHGDYMGGFEGPDSEVGFPGYLAEADLVVAAVNALPALIQRLRKLERVREAANDLDGLKPLVDEQAEDEGLWFIAATAPEAYLQQELRRLHEAVEAALEPSE